MIIEVLDDNVKKMSSNNAKYFFDCGLAGYYNLTADEASFPGVIYDFDSTFKLDAIQSGAILECYKPILFILFKSEIGWTMKEHSSNAVTPAIAACRELISLLQNDERVESIKTIGDGKMHFNLLNANTSGIEVPFEIKLINNASVCVENS